MNKLTQQQKRVVRENQHIHSGKLAELLGCDARAVRYHKKSMWSYTGVGIPFMCFDGSDKPHWSIAKDGKRIAKSASLEKAVSIVDHLIWCIENGMFNQPRIENPYFTGLKL